MSDAPVQTQAGLEAQPPMPVRRLHNFIYCPRLFYYQWVENIFQENADTVAGSHAHRNVDAPSRLEDPAQLGLPEGAKLRSLKLESEALGLVGVVDIVEGTGDGSQIVDYKKGAARRDGNGERVPKEADAVQVVAHALLLREQGVNVTGASIYYEEEKRRVPVALTDDAFAQCRQAIADAKAIATSGKCPPPLINDPRCLYCSAYPICLPNESAYWLGREKDVPQPQQAPRPENDDGEVLVVQKPGAHVGMRGDQIVVTVNGEVLKKQPVHQTRSIYLYGAIQLSAVLGRLPGERH